LEREVSFRVECASIHAADPWPEDAARVSRQLELDLLFNYASLGVLAVGGLAMNLIVVRFLGEAALGVFNQAYAVYILASQLAVGGVHLSVLRSVAQVPAAGADDVRHGGSEHARVIASGLLLSLGLGLVVGALVLVTRRLSSAFLGSPALADALLFVGPALVLFSLNKTLLAALNGLGRMRLFALLQALRFVVLVSVLSVVAWRRLPPAQLTTGFLLSEAAVLVAAARGVWASVPLRFEDVQADWLRKHSSFGARGLLSGVFIELNTRIDVLVIGYFWSDEHVGRYSMAAVFAEGLYQCLIVLKNQMNPVLARLWARGATAELVALVHKAWRYVYPGIGLIYLAGLGVLALLLRYAVQVSVPTETTICYAILGLGVLAVAGFVPFDGILLLAGKPVHYTLFTFSVAASNAALNLVLVPRFGVLGAAVATGLALVLSIPSLSSIMRWQLGFTYLPQRPGGG
jgi:O-antigen/teichoic acid export membrane protein